VEITKQNDLKIYTIEAKGQKLAIKPLVYGRYLVGSNEACEVLIDHPTVSHVHAVLEITPREIKLYDMNSEYGITHQGQKTVVAQLKVNDTFKVGGVELTFKNFSLDRSIPTIPTNEIPKVIPATPDAAPTKTRNSSVDVEEKSVPYLIYPYNIEYNFDTSEYIFEDAEALYPIFKYEVDKFSVETIVLYKNKILSVDYIPQRDGVYRMAGFAQKDNDIELPYLPKTSAVELLECKGGEFYVYNLYEFQIRVFSDLQEKRVEGKSFRLGKKDIVSFTKNDISIVIRHVDAPPKVAVPPLLSRDKSVLGMFFLLLLLVSIPIFYMYSLNIDSKEIEKQKAPERIASILYKQVRKIEKEQPKVSENKIEQKPQRKVEKVQKQEENPKKVAPQKIVKKDPVKPVQKGQPPKKTDDSKEVAKSAAKSNNNKPSVNTTKPTPRPSATQSPVVGSKGSVDVYKSDQFAATVSSVVARGGQFSGAKTKGLSGGSPGSTIGTGVQGGSGAGVSTANVSDRIGDPSGALVGAADFSSGAQGIVTGKGFITAGIPSETVIVGSMDPDIIRKILRDHIPQFRYCYQNELQKAASNFSGVLKMVFNIGASGNVTQAGVEGASSLPSSVKGCVINVLRGIQFPQPAGGGTVEVKQPINFYPTN
jgi:hypothetical protein